MFTRPWRGSPTQFDVPDVEAPVNPLDASNPEMRLGEPLEPFSQRDIRIVALIAVALCAVPYAYRLWRGLPPAMVDYMLLPLGAIAAFGVYRFANLVTGAFWIIREGDIRVERLWGNGTPRADHIEGHERESDHGRPPRPVRGRALHRGDPVAVRTDGFAAPASARAIEARAVGAEIVRRLGIGAEASQI